MPRCQGSKPDGTPCERIVGASQTYSYSHSPERASERKRNAARAGASRPNREIKGLKDQLAALYDDVLAGRVDKGTGAVLAQIANARSRALTTEMQVREQEELIQRIERLEGIAAS